MNWLNRGYLIKEGQEQVSPFPKHAGWREVTWGAFEALEHKHSRNQEQKRRAAETLDAAFRYFQSQ